VTCAPALITFRAVQNLALNVADKGFTISVFNRSSEKTDATVSRAAKEGLADKLTGYHDMKDFVASLQKPRAVIILVQAGNPVDQTIEKLCEFLEPGDVIVDGGNEWCVDDSRLLPWLWAPWRPSLSPSTTLTHSPYGAGTRTQSVAPSWWRRRASCTWAWA
jgi:hypothetical protein